MFISNTRLNRIKVSLFTVLFLAFSIISPSPGLVYAGDNPPLVQTYGYYSYDPASNTTAPTALLTEITTSPWDTLTNVPCVFVANTAIGIRFATNIATPTYWDTVNKTAFHMYDAADESISILVDRSGDGTSVDVNKNWAFVVPQVELQPSSTYRISIDADLTSNNGTQAGSVQDVYFTTAALAAAPVVSGAEVSDSTHIVLTMSSALTGSTADSAAFTVAGAASGPSVTAASVSGTTVTLALSAAIAIGETITVSYFKTNTNNLTNGTEVENFSNQPVTNNLSRRIYSLTPAADSAYTAGETSSGIDTMTVNTGVSGLVYFTAIVNPIVEHTGTEKVVFTHTRNGIQINLNATGADFDLVNNAQAGFNVKAGDIVKVYIVDDLTNAIDFNPTILE